MKESGDGNELPVINLAEETTHPNGEQHHVWGERHTAL